MAGLISTAITISQVRLDNHGGVKRHMYRVTLATDTAAEYPPDGVPMPGFPGWDMVRNLDTLVVMGTVTQSGLRWQWDAEQNSLRAYVGTLTSGNTVTINPAATGSQELSTAYTLRQQFTLYVEATGW